jgi:hypothetical protein
MVAKFCLESIAAASHGGPEQCLDAQMKFSIG